MLSGVRGMHALLVCGNAGLFSPFAWSRRWRSFTATVSVPVVGSSRCGASLLCVLHWAYWALRRDLQCCAPRARRVDDSTTLSNSETDTLWVGYWEPVLGGAWWHIAPCATTCVDCTSPPLGLPVALFVGRLLCLSPIRSASCDDSSHSNRRFCADLPLRWPDGCRSTSSSTRSSLLRQPDRLGNFSMWRRLLLASSRLLSALCAESTVAMALAVAAYLRQPTRPSWQLLAAAPPLALSQLASARL